MTSSQRSRTNAFAALDIDRGAERREDAAWLAGCVASADARFVVLDAQGRALLDAARQGLLQLDAAHAAALCANGATYLGTAGATQHFALRLDAPRADDLAAARDGVFVDLRHAGASLPAFEASLFAYARGIAHWQAVTRHCSACAAPLVLEAGGHRARCSNAQCGIVHFPRTDPAVIMIVDDGTRCLLGRGAAWPAGRFSTLAGFVEPGETLEDAVRREVLEETGVRVGECDYHSSQPWPMPASLMLGFTARADSTRITLGAELAEARWFGADELVAGIRDGTLAISTPLSISFRLIEHWLRESAGIELAPVVAEARRAAH